MPRGRNPGAIGKAPHMVLRSLLYGYLGAIVAGLAVGVAGFALELPQDTVATAATPTGIALGLMGLSLPWARPTLARIRRRG